MVRLPRNKKQTYRMNSRPQMWPMGLTLAVTVIFEFLRSNVAYTFWPYTWCWPRIFIIKFLNSFISEWVGRLTLNKGGGTRSFMTMTVTIWWPRSGERIYHIVTMVTSDVGLLSTRLVFILVFVFSLVIHFVRTFWHEWYLYFNDCVVRIYISSTTEYPGIISMAWGE